MKRRDFLKTGLKVGIAANALPFFLGGVPLRALGRSPLRNVLANSASDKILVVIQLQGGNDGLNCVVPLGSASDYMTLRPTLGIDTSTVLKLVGYDNLGFHPSMTGFSTLYGEKKLAILQNVGYANSSLSHFRGTDIWHTATDADKYNYSGWLGKFIHGQNPGYPPTTIDPASTDLPLAIQFGNSLSNLFLSQ